MESAQPEHSKTNVMKKSAKNRSLTYLWNLIRELVVRDMKVRYSSSILGIAWTLANPLMQLMVYYFVFKVIISMEIPRYASYVFIGVLAINWFHVSLFHAAGAINSNRELIQQPGFPSTILPAVSVLINLNHFLLALPILIPFLLIEGSRLSLSILALPILVVLQFILTLGLAYLVSSANVIFRDTEHLLAVLLRLHFFLTPVFYDSRMVPDNLQSIYRLNPMVGLLEAYRALLIQGTQPDWSALFGPFVLALFLLTIGLKIFERVKDRFVEVL
jgi:lipopolysaccharide transport system permease protein